MTALRRAYQGAGTSPNPGNPFWIDAFGSEDSGRSWTYLSTVADTDTGLHNGNPPSLVRLPDGRLVVTYGYRGKPYGIRAKISRWPRTKPTRSSFF